MDEEKRKEMEIGEKTEDVYSEEGRENLVEDGEISPAEEGFMEGAEMDGQDAKCSNCGAALFNDKVVEKEENGEVRKFCCNNCVEEFEKKQ